MNTSKRMNDRHLHWYASTSGIKNTWKIKLNLTSLNQLFFNTVSWGGKKVQGSFFFSRLQAVTANEAQTDLQLRAEKKPEFDKNATNECHLLKTTTEQFVKI